MSPPPLVELVRAWLPFTATGSSTLRGNPKGTVEAAQTYLLGITLGDLSKIATADEKCFQQQLDIHTETLSLSIPPKRKSRKPNWGAARKVLNIYLRNAVYNHYLRPALQLGQCEHLLEVPLDKRLAEALSGKVEELGLKPLPRWQGILNVTPDINCEYQAAAQAIASRDNMARIHLDLIHWPNQGH